MRLRTLTDRRGFTLFELVVVLMVLAVATALVAPSVASGWRSREIRQGTRRVAAVMRSLRERAVRRGVVLEVVLDPDGATLKWADGNATLPEGVEIVGVRGGWRDSEGGVRVLFYPNGGSNGVGVVVASPSVEGLRFSIDVEPLLGSVVIREVSG